MTQLKNNCYQINMAIKPLPILFALLAVLLVAHNVSCEEEKSPSDTQFVENPDTDPVEISASNDSVDFSTGRARCNNQACNTTCRRLGFSSGKCNLTRSRCVCRIYAQFLKSPDSFSLTIDSLKLNVR